MKYPHKATASILINAPVQAVWQAITDPDQIRQYFFGSNAVSDWKEGSALCFRGEWEGKTYEDKGVILALDENRLFRFSYHSSFSPLPDVPENYQLVTYTLSNENGATRLDILQENVPAEEQARHSEDNWALVLGGMKKLVESRQP